MICVGCETTAQAAFLAGVRATLETVPTAALLETTAAMGRRHETIIATVHPGCAAHLRLAITIATRRPPVRATVMVLQAALLPVSRTINNRSTSARRKNCKKKAHGLRPVGLLFISEINHSSETETLTLLTTSTLPNPPKRR